MQASISISEAYFKTKSSLSSLYEESEASAIAHILLEHISGWSKIERLANKQQLLLPNQFQILNESIDRLVKGEPLQYVLGEQYFMGLRFSVNESVLIPRPETEELVQWVIDDNQSRQTFSILDVGTGSGCIPIALKNKMKAATVSAIDLSMDALTVAKKNAIVNHAQIYFLQLNFLDELNWTKLGNYDIVVSNPPYIPSSEKSSLHKNVRDYEPALALFVEDLDPLIFYRNIAKFGLEHLNPEGVIYCEIHQDFGLQTVQVFKEMGYSEVILKNDLYGNPRMVKANF